MGEPLQFLTSTNDWLEKVPNRVINAFDNMIGSGEKIGQSKVDKICAWLAWKINIAIERQRQKLINTLHEQYVNNQQGPVMKAATAIASFVSDPLGAIGGFASAIFSPVKFVFSWLKVLLKEIPRLAANLANIVSALPPSPPNPNINYDKFKLKVGSLSLNAIAKGTAGMKTPEEMFPEPPKPFSKEAFVSIFDDPSISLKKGSKKYKLKKDDEETIKAQIQQQIFSTGSSVSIWDDLKDISSGE